MQNSIVICIWYNDERLYYSEDYRPRSTKEPILPVSQKTIHKFCTQPENPQALTFLPVKFT